MGDGKVFMTFREEFVRKSKEDQRTQQGGSRFGNW